MQPVTSVLEEISLGKGREAESSYTREHVGTFLTHIVRQDDQNSRMLAVCGVPEYLNTEDPKDHYWNAAPDCDGWFHSDFYAFKHLLQGLGASQTWMSPVDPRTLVSHHSEYLHGNPFLPRKVVLDKSMVQNGFGRDVLVIPEAKLRESFLAKLKEESQQAKNNDQPLLVFIFAHGHEDSHGMFLGRNTEDLLHIEDWKQKVEAGTRITLISTALFSGGWCISDDLNPTTLAAAGPNIESSSWNGSHSAGRFCGSIFASALLKAWREEADSAQLETQLPPKTDNKAQVEKTYYAFTGAVYDVLFAIDRFAKSHNIRFTAQDND